MSIKNPAPKPQGRARKPAGKVSVRVRLPNGRWAPGGPRKPKPKRRLGWLDMTDAERLRYLSFFLKTGKQHEGNKSAFSVEYRLFYVARRLEEIAARIPEPQK